VAGLHCRLLQTGIERAKKFASNVDSKTLGGAEYPADVPISTRSNAALLAPQNRQEKTWRKKGRGAKGHGAKGHGAVT
jgi:hypothetical protein